jgi:membrane-associated phospholipid phosphatase
VSRRSLVLLVAPSLALAPPARAQPARVPDPPPLLGARDAAIAGGFAAAGALAAPFDRAIAERLQRREVQESRALARTAVFFRRAAEPGVVILLPALWAAGRLADDRTTAAVGLHGAEAVGAALVTVGAVKLIAGRARPSVPGRDPTSWRLARGLRAGSEYQSFPSGHTTVAFAAASAVTSELAARDGALRWRVGVPLYLGAAAAGWSRMHENRHWATDVVGGAAIGTIAGVAVTRWHRTRPDNVLDRRLLGVGVTVSGGDARLAIVPMRVVVRPRARAGG